MNEPDNKTQIMELETINSEAMADLSMRLQISEQRCERLEIKIREWSMSLPEHPKWKWLRDEMLTAIAAEQKKK